MSVNAYAYSLSGFFTTFVGESKNHYETLFGGMVDDKVIYI